MMMTELTLQILDNKDERLALTNILFVAEPLKPIPMVGDSITLAHSGVTYQGTVFSRGFDYSLVQEHDETAPLRIFIDARINGTYAVSGHLVDI
jgi:hypothetical protein